MKAKIVLTLLWFSLLGIAQGQSIDELRKQKVDANKKIELSNKLLEEKKLDEEKKATFLNLLASQIKARRSLINNMQAEAKILGEAIENNELVISMLKDDLEEMSAEYAEMVRFAQRNQNSYNTLLFLMAAEDTNQAYKRWLYLRQYSKYRAEQLVVINTVSASIDQSLAQLNNQREKKQEVLDAIQSEINKLAKREKQVDSLVRSLQSEQSTLRQEIKQQQQLQASLDALIEKELEAEARRLAESSSSNLNLQGLTSAFEHQRGNLPWPVNNGVITGKFGTHSHPVIKNIQIKSNGIDITTQENANAKSIFAGVVSKVFAIPGGNMAVIIRHGNYLTVYSNLKSINVKTGQDVKQGQDVGAIFNIDGSAVLKFQVWKESQKLDPEKWIKQ